MNLTEQSNFHIDGCHQQFGSQYPFGDQSPQVANGQQHDGHPVVNGRCQSATSRRQLHSAVSRSASAGRTGRYLTKFIHDRRTSVISVAASLWRDVHHYGRSSATPHPMGDGDLDNYPVPPASVTRQLAFGLSDDPSVAPLGKTVFTSTCLAKFAAVLFVLICVICIVLLRMKEFKIDDTLLRRWTEAQDTNETDAFYENIASV